LPPILQVRRAAVATGNIMEPNESRRRSKILGFIIAETVAIGVLLLAGLFVLSARPVNPPSSPP